MLPAALGLTGEQAGALNDDRMGRALDELFECDCTALLTDFVLAMVREFQLRLDEFHNDSTSPSFQGDYKKADGRKVQEIATHRITFGHSKDLRPDLKQRKAVDEILEKTGAKRWMEYSVEHVYVVTDQHDEKAKRQSAHSKSSNFCRYTRCCKMAK